jgi:hypothetical protein
MVGNRCYKLTVRLNAEDYAMNSQLLKGFGSSIRNPAWLCFLWLGMTAGISFIAIPAIFAAPAVTRPIALDAARLVFEALGRAELVALVLLLILVRVSGEARSMVVYVSSLALIQLAQSAWLLPELASRAQQITEGIEPAPSSAHAIYGVLTVAKLLLLAWLGMRAMKAP